MSGLMTPDAVNLQIRRLFEEVLNIQVPADDTDLIDGGYLDSLALVELLVEIEMRFGVSMPLDDLDIDDFRTVARIAEVIEGSGPDSAAA
jgi:methoxymalonate biosynthesis acyl carrier protein